MIVVIIVNQAMRKASTQKRGFEKIRVMIKHPVGSDGDWKDYSQRFRRNIRYKIKQATITAEITSGYPYFHFNSGMFSKFIP